MMFGIEPEKAREIEASVVGTAPAEKPKEERSREVEKRPEPKQWMWWVGIFLGSAIVSGMFQPPERQRGPEGAAAEQEPALRTMWVQPHWWSKEADMEDYGDVFPVKLQPSFTPQQIQGDIRSQGIQQEKDLLDQIKKEREHLQTELKRLETERARQFGQ